METKKVDLADLIIDLQDLRDKGIQNVEIKGTLLCEEDGNSVIVTSEPQM